MKNDNANRKKSQVRTRIAPSPTGPLHIGTARTALFNYLFAKKMGGKFILRIEDTDLERSDKKWEKNILEGLEWLGIGWDEGISISNLKSPRRRTFGSLRGKQISKSHLKSQIQKATSYKLQATSYFGNFGPYRQSERLDIYEKHIKRLLEEGKAFWCWHTKKELEKEKNEQMERKESPKHECSYKFQIPNSKFQINSKSQIPNPTSYPDKKSKISNGASKLQATPIRNQRFLTGQASSKQGIIRLDTPKKIIKFNDLVRGEIEFDTVLLGDISIAKDERTPLYNFAVVVDDYEMKISHIIRGEDHISNTPKQILIQEALGFPRLEYAHLPLILGTDRSKLSKRHGAISVNEYREQGYLPEAMLNLIALLGWNPGDEQEIFSLQELIKEFSLAKIQKGGAIFNVDKLDWLNGYYIRKKPVKELTKLILKENFLQVPNSKFQVPSDYIFNIIALEHPRLKKLSEIREKTDYFFEEPKYEKELLRWKNMSDEEIGKSLEMSIKIINQVPSSKFQVQNLEQILLKEAAKFTPLETRLGNYHQKGILKKKSESEFLTGFKDRGELLWPLRVALSGKKASPGPFEIASVLGKKEVLKRLSNGLKILNK